MNPTIKTAYHSFHNGHYLGPFDTLAELEAAEAERDYQSHYACILQKFWRNILFKRGWKVCEGAILVKHANYGTRHYEFGSCVFTRTTCEWCQDEYNEFYHGEIWKYDSDNPVNCQCHICEHIT